MSRDIRVVRLGASFHGAYCPFEDLLHSVQRGKYIQSRKANMYVYMFFILQLERNPEQQASVCVKLSGYEARFSKSISLIFLTFSLPRMF